MQRLAFWDNQTSVASNETQYFIFEICLETKIYPWTPIWKNTVAGFEEQQGWGSSEINPQRKSRFSDKRNVWKSFFLKDSSQTRQKLSIEAQME